MNLFPNPGQLLPLLERGVQALETIAAELVTARLDRRHAEVAVDPALVNWGSKS